MKSNLLYTAVALVGLASALPAQNYERRAPGYGSNDRAANAVNTVTAAQLTQWMRSNDRSATATADRWCYAMGQLAAYTCPAPETFGFVGNQRTARVDAQTFLNNLRGYEAGPNRYEPGANPGQFAARSGAAERESPGMAACREAVRDRLRGQGYADVHISSLNAEDRPGGEDRVYGSADAERQYGRHEGFDFSCGVNLQRGEVRSVDVSPR